MTSTRNSPCPSGSGFRYKHCCGKLAPASASASASAGMRTDIIDLLNRGSFAELERRAEELLQQDASNGWMWQILAIAQQRRGRESLPALQQAARCLPDDAVAQVNVANALARSGRYAEAAECYDNALRLRPD